MLPFDARQSDVKCSTGTVVCFVVYQFGIQLSDANSKILGTFCARNERDRTKFVDDLKEAISEVQRFAVKIL